MTETSGNQKDIYCFDVFPSDPLEEEQKPEDDTPNGPYIKSIDFEGQDTSFLEKQGGLQYVYEIDHDFVCIKKHRSVRNEFYDVFAKAVDLYIEGDWDGALKCLGHAAAHWRDDGPTAWMTGFIEKSTSRMPPEGWIGVRDLDLKQMAPTTDFAGTMPKGD